MPKVTIPGDFLCSITHELMTDPVATADGHVYEQKAIEKWLQAHDTSPLTNLKLKNKKLTAASLIKSQIQVFQKKLCTQKQFFKAIKTGKIEELEKLDYLDSYLEANDNHMKWTPLHYAACDDYRAGARLLLKLGASIEARSYNGWTPLHVAIEHNHVEMIRLLLGLGAAIEAKTDRGETSLHIAIIEHNESMPSLLSSYGDQHSHRIVDLLLEAKANPNVRDNDGKTPLHYAAEIGDRESVKLLLEMDANYKALTNNNKTAVDLAEENGNFNIVRLIPEYHQKLKNEAKKAPKKIEKLEKVIQQQQQEIQQLKDQLQKLMNQPKNSDSFQSTPSLAQLAAQQSALFIDNNNNCELERNNIRDSMNFPSKVPN